jgi:hypothetical protein
VPDECACGLCVAAPEQPEVLVGALVVVAEERRDLVQHAWLQVGERVNVHARACLHGRADQPVVMLPDAVALALLGLNKTCLRYATGKAGASKRRRRSSGSPSAPLVEGIMPKSYGKLVPSGRIILNGNAPNDPENAYVFGLPFGVSTTWTWSSSATSSRTSYVSSWAENGPHAGCGRRRWPASAPTPLRWLSGRAGPSACVGAP